MTPFPDKINILGTDFSIAYVDKPSDVDLHGYKALWGQIDYWTSTIRVYKNKRPSYDIWHTIFHEVLHGICERLKLEELNENEDAIDLLVLGLMDVLGRNKFIDFEKEVEE